MENVLRNTLRIWGTYWEHVGTHWELKGNIVGTHWEPGKNEKNSLPPLITPQNLKGKESRHHECMLGPSHWLHAKKKFSRVCHHFLASTNTPCKEHPTYSPLLLIRWGASQFNFYFYFFPMRQFWLAHHSKNLKLWRLPKTKGSILKYIAPPLWPTNIGERRTPFFQGILG
jgi:hypothetical protein